MVANTRFAGSYMQSKLLITMRPTAVSSAADYQRSQWLPTAIQFYCAQDYFP